MDWHGSNDSSMLNHRLWEGEAIMYGTVFGLARWNVFVICGVFGLAGCGGTVTFDDGTYVGARDDGGGAEGGTGGYAGGAEGGSGGYAGGAEGGSGGYAGGSTTVAGSCELSMDEPECDSCFQSECLSECSNFQTDPSYDAYATCLMPCGDQSCTNACDIAYPTMWTAMSDLKSCINARCPDACGYHSFPCDKAVKPACEECSNKVCGAACSAVQNDPLASDYILCRSQCHNETCIEQCADKYPESVVEVTALENCLGPACAEECS